MSESKIKLALVDDHVLFRKGLRSLIEKLDPQFSISFEADNGAEMISQLKDAAIPDIILMDIDMPVMSGYDGILWLRENHPHVKVLVVSMIEEEANVLRIMKLGVKGYLSKDVEPDILHQALLNVYHGHFYYTDLITGRLIEALNGLDQQHGNTSNWQINDREMAFVKLACTEMTYQQIADEMCVSPKTVDGYRKSLFEKLNLKSRVGLVVFAIKQGWVQV